MPTLAERAAELREVLHRHNYLYYVEAKPVLSDREYDKLYRELTELEREFPDLSTADTPTHRVGGQPLAAGRGEEIDREPDG